MTAKKTEASLALYRWMEHVTKALSDSTIRNKFFHEHVEATRRAWEDFKKAVYEPPKR